MAEFQVLIAGRGGQGILLAGYILSKALIRRGYYVVNSEEYTPETRGGDSVSEVIFSGEEEPCLLRVRCADIAVFMYKDQVGKFSRLVSEETLVILDSTYIAEDAIGWGKIYRCPFSRIAKEEVGDVRAANLVMLGFLSAVSGIVSREDLEAVIREMFSGEALERNLKALALGYSEGLKARAES
jgi:2-oxoglutarate ferredoxin oxidoreductase subunit gamma